MIRTLLVTTAFVVAVVTSALGLAAWGHALSVSGTAARPAAHNAAHAATPTAGQMTEQQAMSKTESMVDMVDIQSITPSYMTEPAASQAIVSDLANTAPIINGWDSLPAYVWVMKVQKLHPALGAIRIVPISGGRYITLLPPDVPNEYIVLDASNGAVLFQNAY